MDAKTAGIIAKFKQNHSLAEQIMQSGDGQQLMNMLTREDGGAALERATHNAAAGNTQELAQLLGNLMRSPEGAALMNRLNETAKK